MESKSCPPVGGEEMLTKQVAACLCHKAAPCTLQLNTHELNLVLECLQSHIVLRLRVDIGIALNNTTHPLRCFVICINLLRNSHLPKHPLAPNKQKKNQFAHQPVSALPCVVWHAG